jgi:hypothetical protein
LLGVLVGMMRFAIVRDVQVINVIIAESQAVADAIKPSGSTAYAVDGLPVGTGWTLINETWNPPVPVIEAPRNISAEIAALQARIAELQAEA